MTSDDDAAWLDFQARVQRRASAAANVLAAVVLGVLGAFALVWWWAS